MKIRSISAYPSLNSVSISSHNFLMVGGVGLNFSAPLTGIDINVTDHKASGKRLLKEVVSSLVSTRVPQKCLKSHPTLHTSRYPPKNGIRTPPFCDPSGHPSMGKFFPTPLKWRTRHLVNWPTAIPPPRESPRPPGSMLLVG